MCVVTQGFKDAERGGINDPSQGHGQSTEQFGEQLGNKAAKLALDAFAPSPQELMSGLNLPKPVP